MSSDQPKRTPTLWSVDHDSEALTASTMEDAIVEHLDQLDGPQPDTCDVFGFAPMVPDWDRVGGSALDGMYEDLSEEFGGPDDGMQYPSDEVRAAFSEFMRLVAADFRVWMCEEVVAIRDLDIREYHLPEGN